MKKTVALQMILVMLFVSTLYLIGCTPYHSKSAAICGTGGGVAGALIDKKNPWRGALVGAALGAVTCMAITDMHMQVSREAARTGNIVAQRNDDGLAVQAIPVSYNAQTKCRKVRSRAWDKGKLIGETEEEICEGERVVAEY